MFDGVVVGLTVFSLVIMVWVLNKISGLRSSLNEMKSKIEVMSAPANTLTQVTTTLQQNMGSLSTSITDMTKSIGDIKEQATKIEALGKKYEDTEALTRRIHSIMIGSYEKGRSGENYLRNMMNELLKIGFVRQNVSLGTKVVEYCVLFNDGKLLPIDSKVVATRDVEELYDENTSEEKRLDLQKKIKTAIGRKVTEVCQYINPQTTLPCAVMAVPDSLVDLTSDIVPEAVNRNVMIAGYSAVPQLIVYFVRIHGFYKIEDDVAEMKDKLMAIQQELSKLDDKFFSNRFERPVKVLTNATLEIRQVLSSIYGFLPALSSSQNELLEEVNE